MWGDCGSIIVEALSVFLILISIFFFFSLFPLFCLFMNFHLLVEEELTVTLSSMLSCIVLYNYTSDAKLCAMFIYISHLV